MPQNKISPPTGIQASLVATPAPRYAWRYRPRNAGGLALPLERIGAGQPPQGLVAFRDHRPRRRREERRIINRRTGGGISVRQTNCGEAWEILSRFVCVSSRSIRNPSSGASRAGQAAIHLRLDLDSEPSALLCEDPLHPVHVALRCAIQAEAAIRSRTISSAQRGAGSTAQRRGEIGRCRRYLRSRSVNLRDEKEGASRLPPPIDQWQAPTDLGHEDVLEPFPQIAGHRRYGASSHHLMALRH